MSESNIAYNQLFDAEIASVAEVVLGTPIISTERLTGGEVNYIYKLQTAQGFYVGRIFRQPSAMTFAKLAWIEDQLGQHNIVHAKVIYIEATHPVFTNGWMLQEFIDGMRGDDYLKQENNEAQYFEQLGSLLKKVHSIELERFGDINNGRGEHEDYISSNHLYVSRLFEKFKSIIEFPEDCEKRVLTALDNLKSLESKLKPVLVHTDANPSNLIINKNNEFILIDWDNARGLFWVQDLAYLTAVERYREAWGEDREDHSQIIKNNFLKGHGLGDFSIDEISQLERWSHIIQGLNWLDYFHFVQNIDEGDNRKEAEGVRNIFLELLNKE